MTAADFSPQRRPLLFATCFIALIATSFGFMVRVMLLDEVWKPMFNLSETEKGEIFGVGLWPFAISIVLFSLVIDKIGYKATLWFAVICHIIQAVMLMTAGMFAVGAGVTDPLLIAEANKAGYNWLWIGTFIGALGNGTVEAVINPVIATVYHKNKTLWLTILHAGWPGGLVLAGLLALSIGSGGLDLSWQVQVGVLLFPVVVYGFLLIGTTFPLNERVAAGVPYLTMLKQAGFVGAFIIFAMVILELGRVFSWDAGWAWAGVGAATVLYAVAVRGAPGRLLFIILLLLMIPLATTELGTDAWIKDLLGPAMADFGLAGVWLLIYTAFIMTFLRIFAIYPLTRILSPLAILAFSSLFAATGIFMLSFTTEFAIAILVFATIYGIGQTFFWPCTLGVVSEQFPEGGALTINSIAAVGMLGVGIIGAPLLGNLQDKQIDARLQENPALYEQVMSDEEKRSIFGTYRQLDQDQVANYETPIPELTAEESEMVAADPGVMATLMDQHDPLKKATREAKQRALRFAAGPPVFMLLSYILLILWFKSRGGYKPVEIVE